MNLVSEIYDKHGIKIYRGEVKNGKRHGIGDAYHQNGELLYRGEWKNDKIYIPPFPRHLKKVKFNVGSGGQGSISVYEDTKTKELFAAKKYKKQRVGQRQYLNLGYLNYLDICHKSYVCPFGLYKKHDDIYLVMTYLKDYKELSKVHFSMKEKIIICQKIWNQLQLLHKNNIVHCDLKPSNIMVHPENLKTNIIDFGGAIILSNDPKKKYKLFSTTRNYLTIARHKLHTAKVLKQNDTRTLIRVLHNFLFSKKGRGNYKQMKQDLGKYITLSV